jgi:hypothetical protein
MFASLAPLVLFAIFFNSHRSFSLLTTTIPVYSIASPPSFCILPRYRSQGINPPNLFLHRTIDIQQSNAVDHHKYILLLFPLYLYKMDKVSILF